MRPWRALSVGADALIPLLPPLLLLLQLQHIDGKSHLGVTSTVDVIRSYGYDADASKVVTEDGYILRLTHIKSANTKPPVLMIHGVLAASDMWVLRGPDQDLAFLLVDRGHDVYLGDLRGNVFSRLHTSISPALPEFWDFSFHESGLYDVPALVDAVLLLSNSSQLQYVGHSMGTSTLLVMNSLRPAYNDKINSAALISPIAYGVNKTLTMVLNVLIKNAGVIHQKMLRNIYEVFPRKPSNARMVDVFCAEYNRDMCLLLLSQMYGKGAPITDLEKMRKYLKSLLSGTSTKTLLHLSQIFSSGRFAYYDNGKCQNLKKYKSSTPPLYPVRHVTCPIGLYYSEGDTFVDHYSISKLMKALPNVITNIEVPTYNHIDVVYAEDAPKMLFIDILEQFDKT